MKFDLVASRKWLYIGSGLLTLIALVLLAIPPALRPGIEFTAGTTTQIRFAKSVSEDQLREVYAALGHGEARVQSVGASEFLIRTRELQVPEGAFTKAAAPAESKAVGPAPVTVLGTLTAGAKDTTGKIDLRTNPSGDGCTLGDPAGQVDAGAKLDVIQVVTTCADGTRYRVQSGSALAGWLKATDTQNFASAAAGQPRTDLGERSTIESALREKFGDFQVLEFETVDATVSRAAVRNAVVAIAVATIFILLYIAFAFASVPRSVRYGTCAVIAMLHDVVVTLGLFSLFGKVFGLEVNLMFVTGLLTVIGFSVHDTIVIFDRIRENIRLAPNASLHENVNAAILQTIARSLNTSITVLITVAAMLALGGTSIQSFLLVIFIGIIAGTYSSIGIAAQLLVSWETGELDRLAFWRRREPAVSAG